jgi:hypothetical protein
MQPYAPAGDACSRRRSAPPAGLRQALRVHVGAARAGAGLRQPLRVHVGAARAGRGVQPTRTTVGVNMLLL